MLEYYKGKRVLVTGHTGFKGSWLSSILKMAGAEVIGYSLKPEKNLNLFDIIKVKEDMVSINGDIRDLEHLMAVFKKYEPEYVFHLAAQPIVLEGYKNPVYTYETNVMGTVNFLECVRKTESVRSVLNVTTDKVYENKEWQWGYRENDPLNGFDPYSNSKSCSELVTNSYIRSFFYERENLAVSTVRAGNVIGGGDFADNRIIPDCIRDTLNNKEILIRNPYSIRPFQHVLEALSAYLLIAKEQDLNKKIAGSYNIGPKEEDCITTGKLADYFCATWGGNAKWYTQIKEGVHEAQFLKLDCSKIKNTLNWKQKWNIEQAIQKTVEWTKKYKDKEDIKQFTESQIKEYFE